MLQVAWGLGIIILEYSILLLDGRESPLAGVTESQTQRAFRDWIIMEMTY